MLMDYEAALPGAAERILAMAEDRLEHRCALEKDELNSIIECRKLDRAERRRGQWLGFSVCIILVVAALIASLHGHDTFASIVGGTTIVSVIGAFVLGRVLPGSEPEKKTKGEIAKPDQGAKGK